MAEISVNSNVGVDGNSYTTSISNDQLTSNDFLLPVRTNMDMPTGPGSGRAKVDYIFANASLDNFSFV